MNDNQIWNELTSIDQLQVIYEHSKSKAIVVFKHSTRCIVSKMSLKEFESTFEKNDALELYFLDLLNHRDISNELASVFNVRHESPQMLVIKNGVCIYNASHHQIEASDLKKFI
jgi:bacillithiol system protein YtxJ